MMLGPNTAPADMYVRTYSPVAEMAIKVGNHTWPHHDLKTLHLPVAQLENVKDFQ